MNRIIMATPVPCTVCLVMTPMDTIRVIVVVPESVYPAGKAHFAPKLFAEKDATQLTAAVSRRTLATVQVGGKEQIARNVVNSPGVSMVHVGRHGNVTVTSDGVEFPVMLIWKSAVEKSRVKMVQLAQTFEEDNTLVHAQKVILEKTAPWK